MRNKIKMIMHRINEYIGMEHYCVYFYRNSSVYLTLLICLKKNIYINT